MKKGLIIVESPAKIKTLKKLLGSGYQFASSVGHIRDLPKKEFGIDVEHHFEPKYEVLPDKKEVVQNLKKAAKKAPLVYLAPDPDREGEAIAWHISQVLPPNTEVQRITFQSITKNEVLKALSNPRAINQSLVNAQQARRLLDRIVGYKISPILTRKVRRGSTGSSAGRVQSVALKLVVDREKEIEIFIPTEYWNIKAFLQLSPEEKAFEAFLFKVEGKKVAKEENPKEEVFLIPNEEIAEKLLQRLKKASFQIGAVERKEKKRNPVPPFITSTLQQEASRYFGFSPSRTMGIAQTLYEGVDLGQEGPEGLITYMRTDSVQIAPEAQTAARSYIHKNFGAEYLPEKPPFYQSKRSAQEAHEAIRPTNLDLLPQKIKPYLSKEQLKLYVLIWRRFIASQMKPAIYDTVVAEIETDQNMILKSTGSVLKFSGFLAIYEEKQDEQLDAEKEAFLPDLKEDVPLLLKNLTMAQSFTKPLPRFTEASLVKELEKSGIGRPSTYATIMNKIQSREYTFKENHTLRPTELGKVIAQMLEEHFKIIMNIQFTATMEDELELVAEDKKDWRKVLEEFWDTFIPLVEKAEKAATVPKILTDLNCPTCGAKLQKIWSKNKYFYGCSNYPECRFTTPLEALEFKKEDYAETFNWDQKCPLCEADMILRHGRYGAFLGCSRYPDCNGIVNIPKKGEEVIDLSKMPKCPAKGCEGTILVRKSRFGKTFFSCSLFPDCDVIANRLEDLPIKYKDRPKTPYQKKAKGKKGKGGRGPRKLHLSKELQEVVGEKELSRGEVIQKLWEYIKKQELQDPKNKRIIIPDKKLAKIIGSDPIDMMKLSGFLKNHFL